VGCARSNARAESSVVTPNVNIRGKAIIDGSATHGANLFHSFQEFNVGKVGELILLNPR